MGVMCHVHLRKRIISSATIAAVAVAVLLFASSASAFGLHPTRRLGGGVAEEEGKGVAMSNNIPSDSEDSEQVATQRRLNGPGSAPPKCAGKCGSCRPCKPALVTTQPGVSSPLDYYPLAWRCKCGNKIYKPY